MKAIKVTTEGGRNILVEVSDPIDPIVGNGGGGGRIAGGVEAHVRKLEELGVTIADVCKTLQGQVLASLKGAGPQELTLEFGVKLAGELGLPLVTKGSAEGTFQVTAKWEFK